MRIEHVWITEGSASNKSAFDQISENFVEISTTILNFGKLLNE